MLRCVEAARVAITYQRTFFPTCYGHEFTVAPRITFNGENLTTGYRSGTEFHMEFAAMQHFSLELPPVWTGHPA
jgi:hypothetical protein